MAYHYKESGLDNVYLLDGFVRHKTPYGDAVAIHNVGLLHKAIGHEILHAARGLNGAELRFLRVEMELTQSRLASLLGSEEQTLRRWEKARSKAIPGPADRMLRALYSEFVGKDGSVRRMLERLADLDAQVGAQRLRFKETRKGWKSENSVSSR
mgnify:CR=1 FL=1